MDDEKLRFIEDSLDYGAIWRGLIKGCVLWLLISVIGVGGLLLLTGQSSYYLANIVFALNCCVFASSGFFAAKDVEQKQGRHGLITGAIMGVIYIALLFKTMPLFLTIPFLFIQLGLAITLGAIGGKLAKLRMGNRELGYKVTRINIRQLDRE